MSFPFQRIHHLLIDLDGVLYRGNAPLNHAAAFISWLRHHDIAFRLVTNNATLTQAQYVAKLEKMRIAVDEQEIFTSSLATALYLERKQAAGQRAFIIGEDGLVSALRAIGVQSVEDNAQWVVVGLDRHVTYDRFARAALALQSGATFVGTNPDLSYPSETGVLPGAGALQSVLTATTGIRPVVIGKPEPLMLQLALESLGGTTENTAMLGDRLDTDILGAHRLQLPSILILTGVSKREDLQGSTYQPDAVVTDLGDLMEKWHDAL